MEEEFHTQKGYDRIHEKVITVAMEDYLEMVCRHTQPEGQIRVSDLAKLLHVKTSSASKMAANLKKEGLLRFEKYGQISPTGKGWALGEYLLYRHSVLTRFFSLLNQGQEGLEEVEQMEHFISRNTVASLDKLCQYLESQTDLFDQLL